MSKAGGDSPIIRRVLLVLSVVALAGIAAGGLWFWWLVEVATR